MAVDISMAHMALSPLVMLPFVSWQQVFLEFFLLIRLLASMMLTFVHSCDGQALLVCLFFLYVMFLEGTNCMRRTPLEGRRRLLLPKRYTFVHRSGVSVA